MDGSLLTIAIFLLAAFAGALIAGATGFAFGLVADALWLHILTPIKTATLIIAFGLVVQGYAVSRMRRALDWRRLWPFILGAAFGVPAGVAVLGWADPASVRAGTGVFLILYSAYALLRPALAPMARGGAAADAAVGFLNGVLGGVTGLAGILVTIWCGLRGWPKDEQRAVFQPAALAIFAMSAAWLGAKGALSGETVMLFLIGLPALAAGTWLGFRLYRRLDDAAFRKAVLILLLISGVALVI
ncbi:MAG TPA: sulfite exporter TauE/SafE family protein [Xanthobacteraceae bacterium]|nr:sulfite exporter TauE/SafE family protein [Xanthobacteraceae bacterium]